MVARALTLASALDSVRELPAQRSLLELHLHASRADGLAVELEGLFDAARSGSTRARTASVAVASWIAHKSSDGSRAIEAVHAAAERLGLVLTRTLLHAGPPRSALARGGRLPEVCIGARAPFLVRWPTGPTAPRELEPEAHAGQEPAPEPLRRQTAPMPLHECIGYFFRSGAFLRLERMRLHPDPIFVRRLLEARWLRLADALVIASRRPSSPEIAWSVAKCDRWLASARVREALAANPFSPSQLVLVLLPCLSSHSVQLLAQGGSAHVRAAARLFRADGASANAPQLASR